VPVVLSVVALGVAMASSTDRTWWGLGVTLVVFGLLLAAAMRLAPRMRRGFVQRWSARDWVTAAFGLPAATVLGLVIFAGAPAVVAVNPIVAIACTIAADRRGAVRTQLVTAYVVAAAAALFALLWGGDLQEGFATLVQGSVLSLLAVLTIAVGWSWLTKGQQ
jgi:hypothetical protein